MGSVVLKGEKRSTHAIVSTRSVFNAVLLILLFSLVAHHTVQRMTEKPVRYHRCSLCTLTLACFSPVCEHLKPCFLLRCKPLGPWEKSWAQQDCSVQSASATSVSFCPLSSCLSFSSYPILGLLSTSFSFPFTPLAFSITFHCSLNGRLSSYPLWMLVAFLVYLQCVCVREPGPVW